MKNKETGQDYACSRRVQRDFEARRARNPSQVSIGLPGPPSCLFSSFLTSFYNFMREGRRNTNALVWRLIASRGPGTKLLVAKDARGAFSGHFTPAPYCAPSPIYRIFIYVVLNTIVSFQLEHRLTCRESRGRSRTIGRSDVTSNYDVR